MKYKLFHLCDYVKEKITVDSLSKTNYISTENMLPNRGGLVNATTLPTTEYTQAYCANDMLVSNIRPYFKKIWFAETKGGCSNDVLVFRAKEGVNAKYLYYVLSDDAFFNYSNTTSKGTKMPRGDKDAIMQYDVVEHTRDEQEKIAKILSVIDDKIANNNAINNNLHQQAQAVFKAWFVDYEPFGGIKPIDWKTACLENLAKDIICGKTPPTKQSEYYGDDIPFITIPDMHNSIYIIKTERSLSNLGANSQAGKTLPPNSICVSCIGTAGLVSLVSSPSQTNQQINSIIPQDNISPYFVYLLMCTLSGTIQNLGSAGSTICNLNKGQFTKMEIIIPKHEVIASFHSIVAPMFEAIRHIQHENHRLATLRDALLPKLMSGEIDVSKVKI